MSLAIIILNWNHAADTIACVRAIQTWHLEPKQVWVVDNASAAGEADHILQAHPDIRLIRSETNRGFAGGNNLALREALQVGNDEILLLNNDVQVGPEAIECLQQVLHSNPSVGLAGPVLWDSAASQKLLSAGGRDIAHYVSSHLLEPLPDGQLRFVDHVPGTCVLIRAELLHQTGLLDEDFFFGGEVAALCRKAAEHGFKSVVVGGAAAYHAVERSSAIRQQLHIYYVIRNRFLYVRRFYPDERARLFAFWTSYAVYLALLAAAKGQWQRLRAIGLACVDGWRGRFGAQNARVTKGRVK
jgi:GT2 family glycosyltransferase